MLTGKQRVDVCRSTRFHFSTTPAKSLAAISSLKRISSPISARRSSAVEKCIARTKAQPLDSGFATRWAKSSTSGNADAARPSRREAPRQRDRHVRQGHARRYQLRKSIRPNPLRRNSDRAAASAGSEDPAQSAGVMPTSSKPRASAGAVASPGRICSPLCLSSRSTLGRHPLRPAAGPPHRVSHDDLKTSQNSEGLRIARLIDPEDHAARRFLGLTRLMTAIEVPFANNLPPPLRKRRTSLATARLTSSFRLDLKSTSFKTFLPRVTCADTRIFALPPHILASVWERPGATSAGCGDRSEACSGSRVSGAKTSTGPKLPRPEEAP